MRAHATKNVKERSGQRAHGRASAEIAWACLLASLIAALYKPTFAGNLALVLAVLIAMPLIGAGQLQMRVVDWGMLLIGVYEIPSLLFSQYRANSIRTAWAIAISVLAYFAIRATFRSPLQIVAFSSLLGLGGVWLALIGLRQFDANTKLLAGVGLTDPVAFRSRLMSLPAPWILGEWLTVLLLALPFACALPLCLWRTGKRWLAAFTIPALLLIVAALSLSCSRAVFWSVVLFCLAACGLLVVFRVLSFRTGGLLFVSSLGALALVLACETVAYPGIWKAYIGRGASQIRSSHGRVEVWNRSLDIVRAHPLWGVGSSNAALFLISTADEEETTGFASRTFSLPVQVLVEKGIFGFLLYGSVLVLAGRECIRNMRSAEKQPVFSSRATHGHSPALPAAGTGARASPTGSAHRAMRCCFAAGLVAVLFRELTYSSVMEHTLTLVLVFALLALLCTSERT